MYLGVLHTEHWQVGLLFLEAGKNVLCEKPFAMNSRQVKDLVAAAKKNNVFLMEVRLKGYSPSCRSLPRGHLLTGSLEVQPVWCKDNTKMEVSGSLI